MNICETCDFLIKILIIIAIRLNNLGNPYYKVL